MPRFNYIYSKLVQDDKDFVGMLAYVIYKQQKVELIEEKKEQGHDEAEISQAIEHFINQSNRQSQINFYKREAESKLNIFSQLLFEQMEPSLDDHYRKKYTKPGPYSWGGFLWAVICAISVAIIVPSFFFLLNKIIEVIFNFDALEQLLDAILGSR